MAENDATAENEPNGQAGSSVEPEAEAIKADSAPESASAGSKEAPEPAAPSEAVQPDPVPQAQSATGPSAPAAAPQPVPVPPAASASMPAAAKPVYAQGCLSAAWADIKATDGWVKKVLFLSLIMCVPILNFVVYGYILNWAREVPFGGRTTMPKQVVSGRNFEVGFYAFVIGFVFGLAAGFVSGLMAWVPLIGWIASIAISFFVSMMSVLCEVRMALSKQLGEGFKIASAWNALKANWSALLGLTLIPSMIAAFVICALVMLFVLVAMVGALPAIASLAGTGSSAAVSQVIAALMPLGFFGFILLLVVGYACAIIGTVVELLILRATAHYIGRYAPQWADEAKVAMGYPV